MQVMIVVPVVTRRLMEEHNDQIQSWYGLGLPADTGLDWLTSLYNMSQVSFPSQFTRSKKYTNLDRLAVEGAFEIYQMQRKNLRIWPLKFVFFFFSDKMIFNSYGN